MQYVLNPPVVIGNPFGGKILTINSLELASILLDFSPCLADEGKATLTLILLDPVSGYNVNLYYQQDPTALDFWNTISTDITQRVFQKLIADGKLPPGALS